MARDIVINSHPIELDKDLLAIIINRIIKDIGETLKIKSLVESNIETNRKILMQLEKSNLLMEFNQKYLAKFLSEGKLSKNDLLEFYFSDEVVDKYRVIEKEINNM